MSVEQRELDIDVDLEKNVATATVTEEIAIEDLFRNGEFRLWQDEAGWSGYVIEDGEYYCVNTRFHEDDWVSKTRVGEKAVTEAVKNHIEDPDTGNPGEFKRRCSPP